jgi:hypothetical protein
VNKAVSKILTGVEALCAHVFVRYMLNLSCVDQATQRCLQPKVQSTVCLCC